MIRLLNAEDTNQDHREEGDSYFCQDVKKCENTDWDKWHKNEFYRLDRLESDGFIHKDGSIKLDLQIQRQ